jgi:hypothetical protein
MPIEYRQITGTQSGAISARGAFPLSRRRRRGEFYNGVQRGPGREKGAIDERLLFPGQISVAVNRASAGASEMNYATDTSDRKAISARSRSS